jgi:magnesium transporter
MINVSKKIVSCNLILILFLHMHQVPVKRQEDIGLSPYELKFRGRHRSQDVKITLFDISNNDVLETTIHSVDEIQSYKDKLIWLNVDGLHNEYLMAELAESLHIPTEILSDVMEPGSRPQTEEFDNGLFMSIKMMQYGETLNKISIDNLSIVVMKNMLITFQEEHNRLFDPVKERLKKHNKRFKSQGIDYLTFALLDVVIDNYIYILGTIGEKIEDLDTKMVINPNRGTLKIIKLFKRELSNLGRYIKPAWEMVACLVKNDSDFISQKNHKHFKELQDNINQAVEILEYYREILNDELNVYHSSMSTRLNDIMALLTIFSVIFIPLSFIAGVYGMNFDNMPELHLANGYYIIWCVMLLIAAGMLWYFKRKKWF